MERGRVKWFNDAKGYGFIERADPKQKDIFVHYSGIVADGFKTLQPDQNVEFDVKATDKGDQAVDV
ncbi:MAG: cold-shock protein, partial [Mycobacteriales bacterium]